MSLLADLGRAVGADHLITDPVALRTYQSDGLTGYRAQPLAVALPGSTAEVVAAVSACDRHGVPFVARGAGTGLSGGALPVAEGIVIGLVADATRSSTWTCPTAACGCSRESPTWK